MVGNAIVVCHLYEGDEMSTCVCDCVREKVSGMEESRDERAEKGQNEGGCTHVYRSLCSYTGMFSHEG